MYRGFFGFFKFFNDTNLEWKFVVFCIFESYTRNLTDGGLQLPFPSSRFDSARGLSCDLQKKTIKKP